MIPGNTEKVDGGYRYTSEFGSVTILENPWHIEFRDARASC
jgi:alpha-D-xyloside xylohydrolase